MATKITPPTLKPKVRSYELYKQELLAWREVTDLDKKKQAVAIALTLPEDDDSKIREKVFDQIDLADLKKDDGLDTLIKFLDKNLKKDDLSDSLEKFEEFEDFEREKGQNITEYIACFDTKYRKIEKLGMKLPTEILAFKLLRKANITKEEKMLVLTGMNYDKKETLYEEAKSSLRKFKGDIVEASGFNSNSGNSIKLEPAFVTEDEALLTAGYMRYNRRGGGGARGTDRPGRWNRGNNRGTVNQRGNGGIQMNKRGNGSVQTSTKRMNPVGSDGRTLTCRSCGSFRHLVADCPDSWENMATRVNITEEEENVVLFTGYQREEIARLGIDARNCAVLDSACSSTVCGETWMSGYIDSLDQGDRDKIVRRKGHKVFKFGGGTRLKSKGEYEIPICLVGKNVTVKTDVVDSDIPLLFSRDTMKKACVKMDLENDTAVIMGKEVALNLTSSGHYCLPVDKTVTVSVNSVTLQEMTSEKRKSTLLKLHRQFAHPPKQRMVALLKDAAVWEEKYDDELSEIGQNCEICKVYAKTPPRPVVAMPMAREFNEKLAMDLKLYNGRWILHMIDMWSRYTVSVFISRKKPSDVIDAMMKNWVGVFGVMGAIFTDNGGEFSSDEMREIASILNVRVCTTAGMSPFQNGLCERVHAVTDMMLAKLEADNKGVELSTLLSWANMARNSLQMWSGYSSHQLVFGKNPNLPNIMNAELPALEGSTTSEVFSKHLNVLHDSRKAYIQTEASERIRRALRSKIRAAEQVYENGESVFYKREGKERWLGPGKVVFQDGKVVFIRHGGVFVRVSPNRLCKVQNHSEKQSKEISLGEANSEKIENNTGVPIISETVADLQRKTDDESITTASRQIKVKDNIQYKVPGTEQWINATVIGRAGKSTGKYSGWFNIEDQENHEQKSINLDQVDYRLQEVKESQPCEEVNTAITTDNESDIMKAKKDELEKLIQFDTYEEVENEGQNTVSTRWVVTNKEGKVKARLVARGFEEEFLLPSDSPTVGKGAMKLFLTIASSEKWTIKTTDIKSAFLQGKELDRGVFLKPPKESNTPSNRLWKLKHCLYGLKDGARQFYLSVRDELINLGFKQCDLDPAVFMLHRDGKLSGVVCCHVDDFLHAGDEQFDALMKNLRQRFSAGKVEEKSFSYIGFDIYKTDSESVILDQSKYMEKIQISKGKVDPVHLKVRTDILDSEQQTVLRQCVGRLNWAVQGSRPDMAFEMINLSTKLKCGTVSDLTRAVRIVNSLKDVKSIVSFPSLNKNREWKMLVFTDASLGNINNGTGSTGAHIIWLIDNEGNCCPITWQANKIRRVVRSTIAAEALSLQEGLEAGYYYRKMVEDMLNIQPKTIPIIAYIDNKSVLEAVYSTRLVDDKRLRVDIAAIQELLQDGSVSEVKWCPGKVQLANCMTKQGASGYELLDVLQSGKMLDHFI